MNSDQNTKYVKFLGAIGLLSGAVALISIIVVGDAFGLPGSAEYVTYERFNRFMAVLLALQTGSFIAFRVGHGKVMGRGDKRVMTIALMAWSVMALGTAAEFWRYSDLPYPRTAAEATDFNMRQVAFGVFFLGSLIAGLAFLVLGLRLSRSDSLSRFYALVLVLYLPLFTGLFLAGPSIFTAAALTSIAIAGLTLADGRSQSDLEKVAL